MLRESALAFAANELKPARMRTLRSQPVQFDRKLWKTMAEMGWTEPPALPEGGFGWPGFESPEAVPIDEVHYLMQPWHALWFLPVWSACRACSVAWASSAASGRSWRSSG